MPASLRLALCASAAVFASTALHAQVPRLDAADRALARSVFQQLIEVNSTDSVGSVTAAAKAMQQRLLMAGFPPADAQLLGPGEGPEARKLNLVARYHGKPGSTLKPILFICHLDVVEAKREDWTTDPFQFVEKDGFFYGRGTQDIKEGDAGLIVSFLKMKREGFVPDRDLVLALTADEEGGPANGVDWLVKNHPELMQAEFVINPDAGGVYTEQGKPTEFDVEATEKTYADYRLTVTNKGGHSSLPQPDNAIYQLAAALTRIEHAPFPIELNPITRAYFQQMGPLRGGALGADMSATGQGDQAAAARLAAMTEFNPVLRTTCVATELAGGHAPNALPQRATANVNCRILPGHSGEAVRQDLIRIVADANVTIQYVSDAGVVADTAPARTSAPPPRVNAKVASSLKQVAGEIWPGLPIIPTMEAGASDSIYTTAAGIPSYGLNGFAIGKDDIRAHGRDERLGVESFYTGVEFTYLFVKSLGQ